MIRHPGKWELNDLHVGDWIGDDRDWSGWGIFHGWQNGKARLTVPIPGAPRRRLVPEKNLLVDDDCMELSGFRRR